MTPIERRILSGLADSERSWTSSDLSTSCSDFEPSAVADALGGLTSRGHVALVFAAWEGQQFGLTSLSITDAGRSALAE